MHMCDACAARFSLSPVCVHRVPSTFDHNWSRSGRTVLKFGLFEPFMTTPDRLSSFPEKTEISLDEIILPEVYPLNTSISHVPDS